MLANKKYKCIVGYIQLTDRLVVGRKLSTVDSSLMAWQLIQELPIITGPYHYSAISCTYSNFLACLIPATSDQVLLNTHLRSIKSTDMPFRGSKRTDIPRLRRRVVRIRQQGLRIGRYA